MLNVKQFAPLAHLKRLALFFAKHYHGTIPFAVDPGPCARGGCHVFADSRQDVRNVATVYDALITLRVVDNPSLSAKEGDLAAEASKFAERYRRTPEYMRQASAFLLMLLSETEGHSGVTHITDTMQLIADNLYTAVAANDLEERFELGEVLLALAKCAPRPVLLLKQQQMLLKFEHTKKFMLNDVFEFNWNLQYLCALFHCTSLGVGVGEEGKKHADRIAHHIAVLTAAVLQVLQHYPLEGMETNYLAVTFECLAAVAETRTQDDALVFAALDDLQKALDLRFNDEFNLYAFRRGDMRVDITGHVIDAYMYLLLRERAEQGEAPHQPNSTQC